jgi:hypothetical protein
MGQIKSIADTHSKPKPFIINLTVMHTVLGFNCTKIYLCTFDPDRSVH